jgi:hypothetical protein
MLKIIFLSIVLYIIIEQLLQDNKAPANKAPAKKDDIQPIAEIKSSNENEGVNAKTPFSVDEPRVDVANNNLGSVSISATNTSNIETFANNQRVMTFDKPNPWTKIIIDETSQYPYLFHIKLRVPSLNDYESWKQVVPNLEFIPRSGEIVIPSKDEPSALALANLISINFTGQMSLDNILEKNLIQISIAKSKAHEVVKNKLREQILENLYGKQFNTIPNNFERDLAIQGTQASNGSGKPNFQSENFSDTFEHFIDNSRKYTQDINAYDGSDFTYL